MWTIFLDIDGTLVSTAGAGLKSIARVMSEEFGLLELPQVAVHGRTDYGIWIELFEKSGVQPPDDLSPLIQKYCDLLEVNLDQQTGHALPGVDDFLRAVSCREDVAVGLLTGNARQAAIIKLKRFGLHSLVEDFGGFGDDTGCRNEVARRARRSAEIHLERHFDPDRLWVLGDTIHDITCARAIGARVLAVETGGQSREQLNDAQPDLLFADLSDTGRIVDYLFRV